MGVGGGVGDTPPHETYRNMTDVNWVNDSGMVPDKRVLSKSLARGERGERGGAEWETRSNTGPKKLKPETHIHNTTPKCEHSWCSELVVAVVVMCDV